MTMATQAEMAADDEAARAVRACQRAALRYRALGYNPIPARSDRKGPAVMDYGPYRDGRPVPTDWIEGWWTPNLQLATGCAWSLVVVDLDGAAAQAEWEDWVARRHPDPAARPVTWTVRTGGGGRHLYFTLPDWLKCFPSRRLWGRWDPELRRWAPHQFIELLADRRLVIAPPSRHVETGKAYRFEPGCSPEEIAAPAPAPEWLLWMPAVVEPTGRPAGSNGSPRWAGFGEAAAAAYRRAVRPDRSAVFRGAIDVSRAIDPQAKLDLVRSWGLRLIGGLGGDDDWVTCRAVDRPDVHPSASFNTTSGYYVDHANGARLSLFDLGVALGHYPDWRTAMDDLRQRFGVETHRGAGHATEKPGS